MTIPDDTVFRQGEKFVKTWQIKNAGTCAWGPTYALIFAGGEIMNGPQSVPLPSVQPGALFTVSVDLVAPANGGTYLGDWEFQRPDGTRFGVNSGGIDMIWVKIEVSYVVVSAAPGAPSTGTSRVAPGASPAPASCSGQPNSAYIDQVLALINGARASNNLKPAYPQPAAIRRRPGPQR